MTLWSCRKQGLIRKIRLISKFMTSQTGYQTTTIYILPNISRSKGNQKMRFGQVIEYNQRNIFLPETCRKWGRETSSRLFLFFEKALYKVKAKGLQLSFNIFRWPLACHKIKTNCKKLSTVEPEICTFFIF